MTLIDFTSSTDRQGQLMLAYADGDVTAFEQLYSYYKAPMYRFFLRQCGNRAIAEELYQELWMRVINARPDYRHTARFNTWLYQIAHNLLLDIFRKAEPESSDEALDTLEAEPDFDPVAQYASQERIARFLTLLQALPDAQRQVFLLKEEAGLSLEEIAQVTNCSFENVKSRLRYALRKLRLALQDAA